MSLPNIMLVALATVATGLIILGRSKSQKQLQLRVLFAVNSLTTRQDYTVGPRQMLPWLAPCKFRFLRLRLWLALRMLVYSDDLQVHKTPRGKRYVITVWGNRKVVSARSVEPWTNAQAPCGK